jgi:carbohydrate-selective porin OprB
LRLSDRFLVRSQPGRRAPACSPGGPGAQPEQEANQPPAPAPNTFERNNSLGDPGGRRTKLSNRGIDFKLGYIAEFGGNVSGENTGAGYAGQEAFTADIDWEKPAGLTGFNPHIAIVNRNENNVSSIFGDRITQDGALHPQHNEYAFELGYVLPMYRGVFIKPGIQYFLHPDGDPHLKDAFVFAGRLRINF